MQDQYDNYKLDGRELLTLDLFRSVSKASNVPLDLCF